MPHIHEKIDWCVGVYIVHKNKVLIRLHDKYPMWIHVGGHIELDEDPITAAIRECKEEVGLDIEIYKKPYFKDLNDGKNASRELPAPMYMNIHSVGPTHQHIDLIYFATSKTNKVIPEKETDQWKWITQEEVEQNDELTEKIKTYATNALRIFNKT